MAKRSKYNPTPTDPTPAMIGVPGAIAPSATVEGRTRAEWDVEMMRDRGKAWMAANKGLLDRGWDYLAS